MSSTGCNLLEKPNRAALAPGICWVAVKDVSQGALESLLLTSLPQYAGEILRFGLEPCDRDISIALMRGNDIVGAYFLRYRNILEEIESHKLNPLEDLRGYQNKRGIEGLVLAVSAEYRKRGYGSLLKNYPSYFDNLDYLFGLQYSALNNLHYWQRRRRLVAENDAIFATLEDLRCGEVSLEAET